jgi:hypothetical protein
MTVMSEKETSDKKEKVQGVLALLFPKYKVLFTPRSLVFSDADGNSVMIDENNFEVLQNIISQICCLSNSDQSSFNPANAQAKAIAEKLMKARQKVA